MVWAALFFLAAAMAFGGYMMVRGVRLNRPAPRLALVHATIALAALGFLVGRIAAGPKSLVYNSALFFLCLAAIGGILVGALREQEQPPVLPLVLLHAGAAVTALVLLSVGLAHGY
jgi:hypothetical protein